MPWLMQGLDIVYFTLGKDLSRIENVNLELPSELNCDRFGANVNITTHIQI